jgi:hypothetical protein
MLHVDGTHEKDGTLQGDGTLAPFWIFDDNKQENIAGPFDTRVEAEAEMTDLDAFAQLSELVEQGETRLIFNLLSNETIRGLAADWREGRQEIEKGGD